MKFPKTNDYTKRMLARAMQSRLAAIVNSSDDGIIGKTLKGQITSWNRGAEKMFGYSATEAIGQSMLMLFPPELVDEEASILARVGRGEILSHFETVRMRKDGQRIDVSVTISPITDGKGKIVGASKIARDITQRKQAEAALRASKERIELAAEATNVGIWEWHLATNRILWDAQMFRIYGINPTSDGFVDYRTWSEAVFPEDLAAQEERLQTLLRQRGRATREFRIQRGDGQRRHIQAVDSVHLNSAGQTEYVVGTNLDINERKEAELRLYRLNRLHRVLSKVGEAIVRTRDSQQLYDTVCRIVVDDGLLRMVCIMAANLDAGGVRAVAAAGINCEYLDALTVTTDGGLLSQGTVGTALRTGKPDFCNDFASDVRMLPWRERALAFGFHSTASFPLKIGESIIGALVLFAGEVSFFEDDEIRLMNSVANELSFALEALQREEQRQQAVNALRASESSMAAAQRIAHFGSWELDLIDAQNVDANPLRWSDEMFRIAGYEPGAVAVNNELFFSLVPSVEHALIRQSVATAIRERRVYSIVHRFIRPSGEARVVHEVGQIFVNDKTGEPVKIVGTAHDITEQKLAESKLRESDESFRTMANSLPQLAWIANPDGFIFWYNQRWFDYTGTTLIDMEGWGWQSVHDPKILPRVIAQWGAAIAAGQPFDMEFPLRGVDGIFRLFLTRAQPLKDEAGRVLQWFGTNTDVDELKRAEEEIQKLNAELEQRVIERTAQLEIANSELEAFSYSISHDLRAPLRGVNGYVRMLMEDYGATLDADAQRLLGVVSSEARRMGRLIDDLLAFSRLGRQNMAVTTIDMTSLARAEFEKLTQGTPETAPRIELYQLPAALGEPAMLRQVFANLLANAIKFSNKHAKPVIEVGSKSGDGEITYYVKDNGIGFDARYSHKLFGVFQRLHSESEFEGTGIGLALVQRIVHRHGGKVWAESKPNAGATFFFTLPTQIPA